MTPIETNDHDDSAPHLLPRVTNPVSADPVWIDCELPGYVAILNARLTYAQPVA